MSIAIPWMYWDMHTYPFFQIEGYSKNIPQTLVCAERLIDNGQRLMVKWTAKQQPVVAKLLSTTPQSTIKFYQAKVAVMELHKHNFNWDSTEDYLLFICLLKDNILLNIPHCLYNEVSWRPDYLSVA